MLKGYKPSNIKELNNTTIPYFIELGIKLAPCKEDCECEKCLILKGGEK